MKRLIETATSLLLLLGGQVQAGGVISFSSYSDYSSGGGDYTIGETFTVDHNVTVTALGYLNVGSEIHSVGIYAESTQALLVSANVNTASDPLDGFFNYHTLATSYTLTAGVQYVLAGTTNGDAFTIGGAGYTAYTPGLTTDPGYSFFGDRDT